MPSFDIARYLPASLEERAWGVSVRGIGCIRSAPGATYPPSGHPDDHTFDWRHGRVLGAWQLVLIVSGNGECEFERGGGRHHVPAGSVIIIVPGQWHRYRPLAQTGWQELWIELDGTVLSQLGQTGILPDHGEVRRLTSAAEVSGTWTTLLRELDHGRPFERAATILKLLGQVTTHDVAQETPQAKAVRRAVQILTERLNAPPSMPELAREVGMAYATFRRAFRRRIGISPRGHLLQLRLERARRLIGNTPLRLDAIAEQTGFSSAFHLSAAFKQRFGIAPATWRKGGD